MGQVVVCGVGYERKHEVERQGDGGRDPERCPHEAAEQTGSTREQHGRKRRESPGSDADAGVGLHYVRLATVDGTARPVERFQQAAEAVDATRADHEGVARAFVVALARGQHDQEVADHLIDGFLRTRPGVARLLELGDDHTGTDAGGLIHALFTGLLVQSLLSERLLIDGNRVMAALSRIAETLTRPAADNHVAGDPGTPTDQRDPQRGSAPLQ